jgi:WD40 repeat protein
LSTNEQSRILVTPGIKPGYINIFNYETKTHKSFFCHSNPISCLTLNSDATMVATASTNGTLVRISNLATQTKFREVRRGSDTAEIYGVHFSKDSRCLAVTSSKNTVHLFSLCKEFENTTSSFRSFSLVSDFLKSEWSLFNVSWKPTMPSEDSEEIVDPMMNRHITAIPLCDDKEEVYKMFTIGYDGRFVTNQFQFNPAKMEKLKSGTLSQLEQINPNDIAKKPEK